MFSEPVDYEGGEDEDDSTWAKTRKMLRMSRGSNAAAAERLVAQALEHIRIACLGQGDGDFPRQTRDFLEELRMWRVQWMFGGADDGMPAACPEGIELIRSNELERSRRRHRSPVRITK
jgi:hypothetical protein